MGRSPRAVSRAVLLWRIVLPWGIRLGGYVKYSNTPALARGRPPSSILQFSVTQNLDSDRDGNGNRGNEPLGGYAFRRLMHFGGDSTMSKNESDRRISSPAIILHECLGDGILIDDTRGMGLVTGNTAPVLMRTAHAHRTFTVVDAPLGRPVWLAGYGLGLGSSLSLTRKFTDHKRPHGGLWYLGVTSDLSRRPARICGKLLAAWAAATSGIASLAKGTGHRQDTPRASPRWTTSWGWKHERAGARGAVVRLATGARSGAIGPGAVSWKPRRSTECNAAVRVRTTLSAEVWARADVMGDIARRWLLAASPSFGSASAAGQLSRASLCEQPKMRWGDSGQPTRKAATRLGGGVGALLCVFVSPGAPPTPANAKTTRFPAVQIAATQTSLAASSSLPT